MKSEDRERIRVLRPNCQNTLIDIEDVEFIEIEGLNKVAIFNEVNLNIKINDEVTRRTGEILEVVYIESNVEQVKQMLILKTVKPAIEWSFQRTNEEIAQSWYT